MMFCDKKKTLNLPNINTTANHVDVICGYKYIAPNGGYNLAIRIAIIKSINTSFVL